ncbi:uncharacterized protein BX664DRAFT_355719 [Halteromyces radiatus]|uniref:uncharacterized protein n=1 Tax=Halteromyces radiatus TaxID=101107 RepID=UPI00221F3EF3|nr:uncharacterized protein BX664DRAFT_355719 [Halteromyces radiatus]KAI8096348.1 hypothetical protein BX664DRAFT_355719 [Halteromyces radiatus]
MVSGTYQRVGTNNELNGLLFKYKLAKALTLLSLMAVIVMALASIVFPDKLQKFFGDNRNAVIDHSTSSSTEEDNKVAVETDGVKTDTECRLPSKLFIKSEKGLYSPPDPHPSVLKALQFVTEEDYNAYCQNWDPLKGFTDVIPYNTREECGNWQKKYQELHEQRLEQLERLKAGDFESFSHDDKPLYVSYLCKEVPTNSNRGCGGLADRMSGMISTFFYALITRRAYFAHWADENPIPLEILFEQPHVNWTYDPNEMRSLFNTEDNELLGYQQVDTLNQKYDGLGTIMFPDGPSQDFNDLWNASYVEIRSNRAYIIRTFDFSSRYPQEMKKIGLTKENAFGCLADFLFRPTIGARRYLNTYRELFSLKSVLSIGIQIRTDDKALANPQHDDNTLEKWFYYFKCANELAMAKREPHHKRIVYFLVTDSHKLREEFEAMNDDHALRSKYLGQASDATSLVVTNLPLEHIEPDQVAKYINVEIPVEVSRERMTPGVNSALIENWLLSYTDYRVISPQGYGKLAAFHSRNDRATVSLPRSSHRAKSLNCADPKLLDIYDYDWLSHQWSLG